MFMQVWYRKPTVSPAYLGMESVYEFHCSSRLGLSRNRRSSDSLREYPTITIGESSESDPRWWKLISLIFEVFYCDQPVFSHDWGVIWEIWSLAVLEVHRYIVVSSAQIFTNDRSLFSDQIIYVEKEDGCSEKRNTWGTPVFYRLCLYFCHLTPQLREWLSIP